MAKKKKEETPAPGSPAWMATFSDLMNLLLCFFVLLFSMSSVDQGKAEALIQSLANTFSIFDGGGSSFSQGNMISNGADQLSELDEYFSTMGQTDDGDIEQNVTEDENGGESTENTGAVPKITPSAAPTPTMTPEQAVKEENKGQKQGVVHHFQRLTIQKDQHCRNHDQSDPVGDPPEDDGNGQGKQQKIDHCPAHRQGGLFFF